jgi:hypothetical protein
MLLFRGENGGEKCWELLHKDADHSFQYRPPCIRITQRYVLAFRGVENIPQESLGEIAQIAPRGTSVNVELTRFWRGLERKSWKIHNCTGADTLGLDNAQDGIYYLVDKHSCACLLQKRRGQTCISFLGTCL